MQPMEHAVFVTVYICYLVCVEHVYEALFHISNTMLFEPKKILAVCSTCIV